MNIIAKKKTAVEVPAPPTGYVTYFEDSATGALTKKLDDGTTEIAQGGSGGSGATVQADWNATSGPSVILNKPTLGTAALTNSTAYATAAQGVKADSALQPAAIGQTVQAFNANTVVDSTYVHTDNNYTSAEKSKLSGIAAGAEVNVNADWSATEGDAKILNKPLLGTAASTDASAYATATQGTKADTATQSITSTGNTVSITKTGTTYNLEVLGGGGGGTTTVQADWNATSGPSAILNKPTLGSAAATESSAYATATQGTKADSALQPSAIGQTVQAFNANTVVDPTYVHTDSNYTAAEKSKLSGIAAGAEVNVNADWNAADGDAKILNKPTLGTAAATNADAYATAAQGGKADSALQPAAIGTTVQAYSAGTVVDANYVHTDNNYTTAEKTKLAGIAAAAEVNVNADWNASSGDAQILNKPTLGTAAATDASAYATSAQGAKADTAAQLFTSLDNSITITKTGTSFDLKSVGGGAAVETYDMGSRPRAGRFALPSVSGARVNMVNGPLVIINDRIATWGSSTAFSAGDLKNTSALPRKLSYTWFPFNGTSSAPTATYSPKFVDVKSARQQAIALDSNGKLWAMSVTATGTGMTTTPMGTTAITVFPVYAFAPIPFFQASTGINITKIFHSGDRNEEPTTDGLDYWSAAIDSAGNLYTTGNNASGQQGTAVVAAINNWVRSTSLTNVVDAKIGTNFAFWQRSNGDLYFSGNLPTAMCGQATGNKATPVLMATGVATFEYCGRTPNSLHIVKTDGTAWVSGTQANGQFGLGNVTAQANLVQVPSITNAKQWFCDTFAGLSAALLRTDGTVSFAGRNASGSLGIEANTADTNNTSFMSQAWAFQGKVLEVQFGNAVTHLLTTEGKLYNTGVINWRGMGFAGTNTWAQNNLWTQASVDSVVGMRCMTQTGANYDAVLLLTKNDKLVVWGGAQVAQQENAGNTPAYAPVIVRAGHLDNGVEVLSAPEMIFNKVGTITAITAASTTSPLIDGGTGTITVDITTNGITGMVALAGATLTGPGITATLTSTTYAQATATGATGTVSFSVVAADLLATGAAATPQNYTLTINGQPATFTGSRVSDAIAGALTTSLTAYGAAANNTWVEVTEAEYAALQTSVTGVVKAGQLDSPSLYARLVDFFDMGVSQTATTTAAAESAGVTAAVAANSWLYAFQFKTGNAATGRTNYLQLGTKGANTGFASVLPAIANVTNTAGQLKSYVYKGGVFVPTTKDICVLGGSLSLGDLPNHTTWYSGNAGANGVNVNTSTHTLAAGVQSSFIQVLTTPTKQWA